METQIKCPQSFPCFYRKDGICTFWEQAEAIPAAWEKVFPDDSDNDLRAIDTFREPCLTELEKRENACASFKIPFEQGWLGCEKCNETLCSYAGETFRIGDEFVWMREENKNRR